MQKKFWKLEIWGAKYHGQIHKIIFYYWKHSKIPKVPSSAGVSLFNIHINVFKCVCQFMHTHSRTHYPPLRYIGTHTHTCTHTHRHTHPQKRVGCLTDYLLQDQTHQSALLLPTSLFFPFWGPSHLASFNVHFWSNFLACSFSCHEKDISLAFREIYFRLKLSLKCATPLRIGLMRKLYKVQMIAISDITTIFRIF